MTTRPSCSDITVGVLIYQSTSYLEWTVQGLMNWTEEIGIFVLGNDPTEEVAAHPLVSQVYHDPEPNDYYLHRVYRAWNECLRRIETPWVILWNSDMYPSRGWLDALLEAWTPERLVVSALVEPASNQCGPMGYFGTPRAFREKEWLAFADHKRRKQVTPLDGIPYMPCLLDREKVLSIGGYPIKSHFRDGVAGDALLFKALGLEHVRVDDSLVYHVYEGEMRLK